MKITIINKSSAKKPSGWCVDLVDAPPLDKK